MITTVVSADLTFEMDEGAPDRGVCEACTAAARRLRLRRYVSRFSVPTVTAGVDAVTSLHAFLCCAYPLFWHSFDQKNAQWHPL